MDRFTVPEVEAQERLDELLDWVEAGHEIVILTARGATIAMVPVSTDEESASPAGVAPPPS